MCQAWVRVCCFSSGFLSDVWAMLGTETLIVRFLYLWYFIHQNKSLMSVVVRGSLRRSLSRRRKTSLAKTLDLKKSWSRAAVLFWIRVLRIKDTLSKIFFYFDENVYKQDVKQSMISLMICWTKIFLFSHLLMITNIVIYSYS